MCLAIPATVLELLGNNMAEVEMLGVTRKVSIDMIEDAHVGDWLLVHAGFAIDKVDEDYAADTLELIKSIPWVQDSVLEDQPVTGPSDRFLEIAAQAKEGGTHV